MKTVIVRAISPNGFYRGGRFWPHEETEAQVDDALLARLKDEKQLLVVEVNGQAQKSAQTEETPDEPATRPIDPNVPDNNQPATPGEFDEKDDIDRQESMEPTPPADPEVIHPEGLPEVDEREAKLQKAIAEKKGK